MIYLTSHMVHYTRFQREATHSFLHRQQGVPLPEEADPQRLVDKVSQDPGELIAAEIVLPPGGNAVLAFLEVVAGDDMDADILDEVHAEGAVRAESLKTNTFALHHAGAYLRFYAQPSLDQVQTYTGLASASRQLFANPTSEPLTIVVEHEDDESCYYLDVPSAARIRHILGPDWIAARVRVADDVSSDFSAQQGNIKMHIIDVCTGLDRTHVGGLGGVRFVDTSGQELARYPEPLDAFLRHHRQVFGANDVVLRVDQPVLERLLGTVANREATISAQVKGPHPQSFLLPYSVLEASGREFPVTQAVFPVEGRAGRLEPGDEVQITIRLVDN